MATVEVGIPFKRKLGSHSWLDAWSCLLCTRVELTYQKIVQHVAVEHGWRPVKNLKRAT
jgi:hypothetical protein